MDNGAEPIRDLDAVVVEKALHRCRESSPGTKKSGRPLSARIVKCVRVVMLATWNNQCGCSTRSGITSPTAL